MGSQNTRTNNPCYLAQQHAPGAIYVSYRNAQKPIRQSITCIYTCTVCSICLKITSNTFRKLTIFPLAFSENWRQPALPTSLTYVFPLPNHISSLPLDFLKYIGGSPILGIQFQKQSQKCQADRNDLLTRLLTYSPQEKALCWLTFNLVSTRKAMLFAAKLLPSHRFPASTIAQGYSVLIFRLWWTSRGFCPAISSPALQHTQLCVIQQPAEGAFHRIIQAINNDYKCKTILFGLTNTNYSVLKEVKDSQVITF